VATAVIVLSVAIKLQNPVSGNAMSLPFNSADGRVVANEYAYWHPTDQGRVKSKVWEMTSGSLLARGSIGWTGTPDAVPPDRKSTSGTNSAIFRLTSIRHAFGNVDVSFRLFNCGLSSTERTPPADWDGVHVFLRYKTQYHLYYASINRRDNTVTIKKKVPGGTSNDGTYYQLGEVQPHPVPYGRWQDVRATVEDLPDGSVRIQLYSHGRLLVSAVDTGIGGDPIRGPARLACAATMPSFW
jgi:hypothetical protein